jgi:molybdopterin-containing oxidoreductase family iron-sulfur binding subunit
MSKHIQVESGMSLTGSNADERVRLAPSEVVPFLELLARRAGLSVEGGQLPAALASKAEAIAQALEHHRGHGLLLCGLNEPRAQELCARINHVLGHDGVTVDLARPSLQKQGDDRALDALVHEMAEGKVAALILLGSNPIYDLPAAFASAFSKVPLRVSMALTEDESAALCTHLAPDHHWLETWRDSEPVAGTHALLQPLINPLFATRDGLESFTLWSGHPVHALEAVREHWKTSVFPRQKGMADFETFWNAVLQKGVVQSDGAAAPSYRDGRVEGTAHPARNAGY